jgi:hypothetical protein
MFHGGINFLASSGRWERGLSVERKANASLEMEKKNYIFV